MTQSQWDYSKPVPSENFSAIYTYIRKIYQLFLERFGLDHNMDNVQDTTLATADGYHKQLTMAGYTGVSSETGATIIEPEPVSGGQQYFVKKINGLHELCALDYNGDKWQITETGYRCYEFDTFTKKDIASGCTIYAICHDGSKYVIVASGSSSVQYVYTSTDLETFTLTKTFSLSNGSIGNVTYGNGAYLLSLTASGSYSIYKSTDCVNWTNILSVPASTISIIFNGTNFIISSYTSIYSTYDGSSISTLTTSAPSITNVYYANGVYFGTINVSNVRHIYKSTNLTTWTFCVDTGITLYNFYGNAFYARSKYYVNVGHKVYSSADLTTWILEATLNTTTSQVVFLENCFYYIYKTSVWNLIKSKTFATEEILPTTVTDFMKTVLCNNIIFYLGYGTIIYVNIYNQKKELS